MKSCKNGCTYSFSSGWRWLGENKKTQWNVHGYTAAYVAPTSMISVAWRGTLWLGTLEWKRPRSIAHYAQSSTLNPGRGWSTQIVMGTVPMFSLCRPKRRMPWGVRSGICAPVDKMQMPDLGERTSRTGFGNFSSKWRPAPPFWPWTISAQSPALWSHHFLIPRPTVQTFLHPQLCLPPYLVMPLTPLFRLRGVSPLWVVLALECWCAQTLPPCHCHPLHLQGLGCLTPRPFHHQQRALSWLTAVQMWLTLP